MSAVDRLLAVARAEIGYTEKATPAQLDDKLLNAGSNNYTKYARDFDTKWPDFFNGRKNGYAWCDVFVDWCHVQAFGVEKARELLCQPKKSYGAGVNYSRDYFKDKGRLHDKPRLGAQVFFGTKHTGIVSYVSADGKSFRSIEGNTNPASGVVANGGMVCEKSYTVQSGYTFGWQDWALVEDKEDEPMASNTFSVTLPLMRQGDKGPAVRAAMLLLKDQGYYSGIIWARDNEFGPKMYKAVVALQKAHGLAQDGVIGHDTMTALLGGK